MLKYIFFYYRVLLKLPDIFMNKVNNDLNFREKQIGRGNIGGSGVLQKTNIYLCLMHGCIEVTRRNIKNTAAITWPLNSYYVRMQ